MSKKQFVISGKELVKILQKAGFLITNINGSHYRLRHMDGRKTTVPVHSNEDLPKGLLKKIVKEDLQLNSDEFESLIDK